MPSARSQKSLRINKLYQVAVKMITKRQGGGDAGVHKQYVEEPTTKPMQLAFECNLVLPVFLVFALLLLCISFAKASDTSGGYGVDLKLFPQKLTAGDAVLVELKTNKNAVKITGFCYENDVYFFKKRGGKNVYYALVGTDFRKKEDFAKLSITILYDGGMEKKHDIDIKFEQVEYTEEKLTLPKKMVEPPKETLKQIKDERELVLDVYSKTSPQPLFDSFFTMPVTAEVTSSFGIKRVLNGTPKSPHSGIDLRGNVGTVINASNDGIVVLAKNLYFTGNTMIIDHGLGLYTAYFHLNRISRSEREKVKKGEKIGEVGMTGRSTGPHLHFEVKLNGVPVNPFSIISLREKIFAIEKVTNASIE